MREGQQIIEGYCRADTMAASDARRGLCVRLSAFHIGTLVQGKSTALVTRTVAGFRPRTRFIERDPLTSTPPNQAPGAPLDAQGLLAAEIPCAACGYNLRLQPPEGSCPECGHAVDPSVKAWLHPLVGLGQARVGALLYVGFLAVSAGLPLAFMFLGGNLYRQLGNFAIYFYSALSVWAAVAAWLFLTPAIASPRVGTPRKWAWVGRVAMVLAAVYGNRWAFDMVAVVAMHGLPQPVFKVVAPVLYVFFMPLSISWSGDLFRLFGLAGFFVGGAWLAGQLGADRMVRWAWGLLAIRAASSLLSAALSTAISLNWVKYQVGPNGLTFSPMFDFVRNANFGVSMAATAAEIVWLLLMAKALQRSARGAMG
ncbi:MAG: hypothetical protein NTW19_00535 [Planctomycetota bacterium]|nr:hypothetical protein [Planctomycetota bacterium]